jgi:hypothetical protein
VPNSKRRGDATESRVIHKLVTAGHDVAVPFGDNAKYDLIVDDDGDLYRVQCKTAWRTGEGTIRFNTYSQTTRDGEYHESTYRGEIEAFVVRHPETETIYWIGIDHAINEKKMDLRFKTEIDHPSINWAETYEFDGEIP